MVKELDCSRVEYISRYPINFNDVINVIHISNGCSGTQLQMYWGTIMNVLRVCEMNLFGLNCLRAHLGEFRIITEF